MQGDANVIRRDAINVNQGVQMINCADAFLHVGRRAYMLMRVACCKHVRVRADAFITVAFYDSNYISVKIVTVVWCALACTFVCQREKY